MRRVLIANRGEIAVRIIRACREAGLETVAVYSDADARSPHVALADVAARLGPAPARESYLNVGRIIDAARVHGADAIHPGYGFLAENAGFAAACADAGLTFIGPPADVIEAMGSKTEARRLMRAAGVPVVPGVELDDQSDATVRAAATTVGFPLLVKASAGGGGKGMRVVRDAASLLEAVGAARREAQSAFGDDHVYLERLVDRPKHVEVQVFADHHGHVVHLFERECSAQRRHQKVIEESPSPALTPALREQMGAAAVTAARACGYRNAGTVEFLLEGIGDAARFYFLEMNTRLQVEHPVTEAVTGIDLVRLQLAIASGFPLPWTQAQLSQRGHAIECRVYAENPAEGFLPQAGRIVRYREPQGPGVRVDAGVVEGSEVTVHYDPLLAKLIVWAESRPLAIARLRQALLRFPVLGVTTNIAFLLRLAAHPAFAAGELDTGFLDRELDALLSPPASADAAVASAVAAIPDAGTPSRAAGSSRETPGLDPWDTIVGWRGLS